MAIFLTGQSRVMIQGITGSEGRRHGARMLAAGTRIVGGTNPRKAGQPFGGIKPANFLDIGGGASAEVMANGLEIVLSDPSVRSVFVNVFGGITSCDAVANGIVSAIGMLEGRGDQVDRPIVVRLDGNNAAEGRRILQDANIGVVEQVATMDGAARRAAELAKGA